MADLPSYYAIIPANVRYDKDLTANAKLLYGEITSLCNKNGFCWAKNEYFSELYSVSKTSISKWISQLVDKGYIKNQLIYKEGTKQILNRYLSLLPYPIEEKLNRPIEENFTDNSTSINTKLNNKSEYVSALFSENSLDQGLNTELVPKEKSCDKKEKNVLWKTNPVAVEILEFLNLTAEKNISKIDSNLKFIIQRLKDHPAEILKQVIQIKSFEWKGDSKMDDYLRPQTLFNKEKFSLYIQKVEEIKQNPEKFKNHVEQRATQQRKADRKNYDPLDHMPSDFKLF